MQHEAKRGFIGIALLIGIAVVSLASALYAGYELHQSSKINKAKLGAVTALTDTIGTFRTNVNATDEALRSTTSSDPGHVHTTASVSGTIAVAQGGSGAATFTKGLLLASGTTAYTTVTSTESGRIPISSGTDWIANPLTAGAGITITTSTGSITIINSNATTTSGVVTSTVTFATSTTSFVVIGTSTANGIASTTLTLVGANRVLLTFTATLSNSSAARGAALDFSVDGVSISGTTRGIASVEIDTANNTDILTATFVTAPLTQAAHTFRALAKADAGTYTLGAAATIWTFSAIELPTR